MKFLKVINTVFILALTNIVNAQSTCSKKITDKGYKCCSAQCIPIYTDEDGDWAVEKGQWCGCGDNDNSLNKCSTKITDIGYSCCSSNCVVVYTDNSGTWGYENKEWCGCTKPKSESELNYEKMRNEYDQRGEEISADGKEIERKWLIDVKKIPYDIYNLEKNPYDVDGLYGLVARVKQTYICFDPEIRVREYSEMNGSVYGHEMTIKTNLTKDGLARDETNIEINQEQYDNMVKKQEGNTINKVRYQFYADGQIVAIDVFEGDLEGLAYMEIEFANQTESDAYGDPSWVIKDVTDDIRYKNGYLARYGIPDPQ